MAQEQTITDLGFTSMGQHMYLVHVTGVVLATEGDAAGTGTVNVPCDQIQGIIAQSTKMEATADYVLNHDYTFSGNTITIAVQKMQLSATRTWGDALTADISDSVYDILVFGI
jgi:hypothetical protein